MTGCCLHSPHVQTVGLSPQVPVAPPVGQLDPDRVAAFLVDHLSHELRRRHVDQVERTEPGAPDGPVQTLLDALRNVAEQNYGNSSTLCLK